jgi:hypothetical protein
MVIYNISIFTIEFISHYISQGPFTLCTSFTKTDELVYGNLEMAINK